MIDRHDFLFELGTEELPPKSLRNLSEALGRGLARELEKARLEFDEYRVYAAPRRLAVVVQRLAAMQPDTVEERRGPALAAAFDSQGEPTPAAVGFARSCGTEVSALETRQTDKGAWLVHRAEQRGKAAIELLPGIVAAALAALPIAKRMRWGTLEEAFVRPVHWLVMLYDGDVVPATLFGQVSGRESRGHRFHHPERITLASPAGYAPLLSTEGRVLVDFAQRREAVYAQVSEAAQRLGARAEIDPALLDEVTAMVEWPCAVTGGFEERFLQVPEEVLISVMKGHQKYFHLRDADGRLMAAFVTVSNIESRDPQAVRAGNERVIRPRLSDAMFFWDQDRRNPLADRMPALKQVVFQRGLGTIYDKCGRLAGLAHRIAAAINGNPGWAERAAWLSKCDLVSDMVGEFPELQGIMGRYYARHDDEPAEVAEAIAEQYQPRGAGDALPWTATGKALAIADKLDTVVGIFGLGQAPTGDRDPFALRRAALGLVRIMIEGELNLDLRELISESCAAYRAQQVHFAAREVGEQVYEFIMDRLRAYYQDAAIPPDVFEAVFSRRPGRPLDFDARIRAVQDFRGLPESASLAAANKRIGNILRKTDETLPGQVDDALLQEPAERKLAQEVRALASELAPLADQGEYTAVLRRLAGLRPAVDGFFDSVLVMCDDAAIRGNRLVLLRELHLLFLQVADLSCLSGAGDPRGR
ncbi:MAG: glycine--tRNA ligase subunit beta [Gammaproteobacteria bacterium]|jgi:glycyl-tRNA synthetase beta chain|nr:glycine--tRNA ligase subunit beta [Gammaproteobacteria bacterium]